MNITATAAKFAAFKAQAAAMSDAELVATIVDTSAPHSLREYARDAQITRGRQTIRTTVPARQLYPTSRLAPMPVRNLNMIFEMVHMDATRGVEVYDGMTREETEATAYRSCADILDELHGRALACR